MDDTPFYQRPGFYIVSRLIFVLILYAYALFGEWRTGELTPLGVIVDLAIFGFLLIVWLAFFAQFVLPVQTFEERRKIFYRLIAYLSGLRGPAIFVKNGQAVSRIGESERSGPGVLWLDSASGAVTHINVSFKNTIGPGVHFTGWGEKVGETVDLHTQVQKIGPHEDDCPFDAQGSTPDDVYSEVQKRRTMVSALSRDGIEVVPDISVVFKIDADPVRGAVSGSHFGYDEEAVRRAVINQAVNPSAEPNTLEFKVAWNELPAALAADLWREYLSKFTLTQLFTDDLILPASMPLPEQPASNPDASAIHSPVYPSRQNFVAEALTGMLHEIGSWLGRIADSLEAGNRQPVVPVRSMGRDRGPEPGKKTALQVINFMMRERMTKPMVAQLDPNGQRVPGWQDSREYRALKNRGIRVISVNVSNLRFLPAVEERLVSNWTSNWLLNARAERERIETARSFASLSGQERALTEHAQELAADLMQRKKEGADLKQAVKSLLARSRMILIRNDRMHRRASNELQELEEVMQWLESDPT
jgi:hypothetical protein